MTISDIKSQQKNKQRVSVYVDGSYSFSLSLNQLQEVGLKIDQPITPEQIIRFKKMSEDGKLFDRVLNWLARRPRSEWEVRDYLMRKQADEEHTESVIKKLQEYNYIDDYDFAARWVQSRRLLKHSSKRKLQVELRQKRVPQSIIERVLREDSATDKATLRELISVKQRQSRYSDEQKLMAYLARQGFSYGDIRAVLTED